MKTEDRYTAIHARLAALERLILIPARRGKGGRQKLIKYTRPSKPTGRNRLDSL